MNQNYDIGFRVDMGDEIGSGHFFRCLALAKELIKRKRKIIFITKSKNIKNHVKKNMPFIILKGKNRSEQLKECKKNLKKVKFWIFDLPNENETYSFQFRKYNSAIMDDLGNIDSYSNFVFNGGIVKKFQKYNKNNKTKLFLDPKFMILREEFYNNKNKVRIIKNPIKKILLTFGGNDDLNLTLTVLQKINLKKYSITTILGPTYKHLKKIEEIQKTNKNIKILTNVKDPSKIFLKQDLVISTPGITSYELSCLGIPTVWISTKKEQNMLANEFQKKGFGNNLGLLKDDLELDKKINSLKDYKKRQKMFQIGRKTIDGKGVFRVAEIIDVFLKN